MEDTDDRRAQLNSADFASERDLSLSEQWKKSNRNTRLMPEVNGKKGLIETADPPSSPKTSQETEPATDIYEVILSLQKNDSLTEDQKQEIIKIISPNKKSHSLFDVIISFVIGVLLAFVFNRVRPCLKG